MLEADGIRKVHLLAIGQGFSNYSVVGIAHGQRLEVIYALGVQDLGDENKLGKKLGAGMQGFS